MRIFRPARIQRIIPPVSVIRPVYLKIPFATISKLPTPVRVPGRLFQNLPIAFSKKHQSTPTLPDMDSRLQEILPLTQTHGTRDKVSAYHKINQLHRQGVNVRPFLNFLIDTGTPFMRRLATSLLQQITAHEARESKELTAHEVATILGMIGEHSQRRQIAGIRKIEQLGRTGKDILPILIEALQSRYSFVRGAARQRLIRLGEHDRVLQELVEVQNRIRNERSPKGSSMANIKSDIAALIVDIQELISKN